MSNNDNTPLPPLVLHPDFGDPTQMLNMRNWLEKACVEAGAKFTGGGIGMGSADLSIELEGHEYTITITPILR